MGISVKNMTSKSKMSGLKINPKHSLKNGPHNPFNDPYWDNVVLLIDSSQLPNNSTTISDLSSKNNNFTFDGDSVISTSQSYFGSSSIYASGSIGSGAYTNISSDFALRNSDFTIEMFFYPISRPRPYSRVFQFSFNNVAWNSGNNISFMYNANNSSGKFTLQAYNFSGHTQFLKSTTSVSYNRWYHLALVRQGPTLYMFIDGVLEKTHNVGTAFLTNDTTNQFIIGDSGTQSGAADASGHGHWDQIRVTKGVARYTSDFPLPTESFI